jgi:Ca2+-binding EF-hand superfamily protein
LIRNFKSGKNLVNYKELIRVLEEYSSESQKQNVIYKANRKYLRDKKLQAASKDQKSIVENFKDPAQRNRAALEAIHAKISSKIMHAGDLRLAFEKYDVSRRGRITYDFFVKALAQFGVDLEELEAKTLYKSMDINGEGSFEYGRFIAMVFPPRTKTGRKVIPMGFKASQHTSSNMSTADQLRHVQKCVEKALAKGPRELQRVLGIFRLPGDQDIDHSSLKMMLLDFGLTLTDAQTFALIRYLDPSAKSCIGYYKLISGILPSDCVLEQKGGGSAPSQHHHKPGQKMSDSDFHHDIVARIKRQITRKGPSGVPVGNQLRDVLSEFLCLDDVGPVELKRAFVGVGILIDDADLSRLISLYKSPSHPKMRLSKLIEDIDDKAFDYVFSTGNVAGASLQRIQKEVPAPNESDALTRNKLRRVLKKRMDIDGSKSVVTVLRLHDLDRTGRSCIHTPFSFTFFLSSCAPCS